MQKVNRVLLVFLAAVLLVFFFTLFVEQKERISILDFKNPRYNEAWQLEDKNGFHASVNLPVQETNLEGESFSLSKEVDETLLKSKGIGFFAFAKKVRITLNDKVILAEGFEDIYRPYTESTGSKYYTVEFPKMHIGDKLNIEIFPEQKLYMGVLGEILLGSADSIKLEVFIRNIVAFSFACLLFILGVISIIVNLWAVRQVGAGPMTFYLGATCIVSALWIMSENPIFTMLLPNQAIKNSVTFFSVMFVPIPILKYSQHLKSFKGSKYISIFLALFIINAIVTFILQYFNIVYFTYSVTVYHIISIAFFLYAIVRVFLYVMNERKKRMLYIVITTVVLVFGGIITILYLYIKKEIRLEPILLATLVLIILVVIDSVKNVFESIKKFEKEKYYEIMATKDFATDAYSRNAYLKRIDVLKETKENIGIILVDLDNLKYINDNLSHILGDEFINRVYMILNSIFSENIYRIGGDEFVIFVDDISEEYYENLVFIFRERIEDEQNKSTYPFGASIGHSIWNIKGGQEYTSALLLADKMMYAYKDVNKLALPSLD